MLDGHFWSNPRLTTKMPGAWFFKAYKQIAYTPGPGVADWTALMEKVDAD